MAKSKLFSYRGPLILGGFFSAIFFAGIFVFGSLVPISGAVVASATVEVEGGSQAVQHNYGGKIKTFSKRNHDGVRKEEVLFQLEGFELEAELQAVEAEYFENMARCDSHFAELDGLEDVVFNQELIALESNNEAIANLLEAERRRFRSGKEALDASIKTIETERVSLAGSIEGLNMQLRAAEEMIANAIATERNSLELSKAGLKPEAAALIDSNSRALQESEKGQLITTMASTEGQVAKLEARIAELYSQYKASANESFRNHQDMLNKLNSRREEIKRQIQSLVVTAPVSGVVINSSVNTVTGVITPGEVVMQIVPDESPRIVLAKVKPSHIDRVYSGQEVTLRFPSLSSSLTPELFGRVETMAPATVVDPTTNEEYYAVTISVSEESLKELEDFVLLPGMLVEVNLLTGDRTLLSYLLKPVTDYFKHALREE